MAVEEKGFEALDRGGRKGRQEPGHCFRQFSGADTTGMPQRRRCRPCNRRGDMRSGFAHENEAAGSKLEGEDVRRQVLFCPNL